MDPIPTETHAAELRATIDELEGGLTEIPLSKAVNRIDDWRRELLATDRDDLRPIAENLAALHRHLTGEGLDGRAIARTLVELGRQTAAVADAAEEELRAPLARLGSLLGHAGRALGGNAGDSQPDGQG